MATGSDVRDILSLQAQAEGPSSSTQRAQPPPNPSKKKKPKMDGISRELYALLGDNTPSLTFTQGAGVDGQFVGGKFMPKFKKRPQRVQKWIQAPFRNPARQDALLLHHWVPESEAQDASADSASYRFADLNTNSGVYSYSNDEYHQHLRDDDWTKEETDYLMDLCSSYDLRFVIIADRYEWQGRQRSMEDLKARYYAICRRLIRSRISTEDMEQRQQLVLTYSFDRAREVERKKHVARLFSRTPQQIAEEEALYVEARRLEQNEARFAAEREELLRLLGGWERTPDAQIESIAAAGSGVGVDVSQEEPSSDPTKRSRKRKLSDTNVDAPSSSAPLSAKQKAELKSAQFDEVHNITRFDAQSVTSAAPSKPPYPHMTGTPSTYPPVSSSASAASSHGAYLRSQRMLAPRGNLVLRTQEALAELQPPISLRLTFPTRANCEKWEGVVGAITSGLEMKRQLDRAQSELRMAEMRLRDGPAASAPPPPAPEESASVPPAVSTQETTM